MRVFPVLMFAGTVVEGRLEHDESNRLSRSRSPARQVQMNKKTDHLPCVCETIADRYAPKR